MAMIAVLACLILLGPLSGHAAPATTNQGCVNSPYATRPDAYLFCTAGAQATNGAYLGYSFPQTFDVSLLSPSLEGLYVSTYAAATVENVVSANAVPFPYRANLTAINMKNFNRGPADPRFPINALFANVRQVLKELYLTNVKLVTLTQADFTGFSALQSLGIYNGLLTSVSLSTFAGVGQLTYLKLGGNVQLNPLDWTVFAPVAEKLETLKVSGNNFAGKDSIISSTPFTFKSLNIVELTMNQMTSVPAAVYESFRSDAAPDIALVAGIGQYDPNDQVFCRGRADCGCCELADFTRWVQQAKPRYYPVGYAVSSINCGGGNVAGFGYTSSNASMSDPELHAHCLPTVNTLKISCTKGVITKPVVDVENVDVSPVEFNADSSRKCSNTAYELHQYIVQKANLRAVRTRSLLTDAGVVASCVGAGVIELNEKDPEVVTTSKVLFNFANTNKCRIIFGDYLTLVMSK